MISVQKEAMIADIMDKQNQDNWDFHFTRHLRDWEKHQLGILVQLVSVVQLQESQEDSIQWKWSEKSDGVISELVVLCLGLGFFWAVVVSCVRGVIYVPLFSPLSRVSGVYWGLFCVFAWVSCLGVGCFALVFVYFLLSQSLVVSVPHVSVCPFSSFPFIWCVLVFLVSPLVFVPILLLSF
ncbi:hypothetical protein RHGRI_015012 [Rhododendron griersonianum]|uniref:Uncharacterized protein n=1 Tax=Rhododendron griersonianum TaxID=479676 RepID=A0AAV6KBS5_9ERIC|nr:hypothetical protein RHGRI_015012 [Rhododendron griersonianum]